MTIARTLKFVVAVGAILALTACAGRYGTTERSDLEQRLRNDFAFGTPSANLVSALVANEYQPRGPVFTDPSRPAKCLSRRIVGALQLAGSRILSVCYSEDAQGNLTAIEVSSVRNNI